MKIYYTVFLILTITGYSCLNKHKFQNQTDKSVKKNAFIFPPKEYKSLASFKGDTVGYIKENFLENKKAYLGKDVNHLIDNIELPILKFLPGGSSNDLNLALNMTLVFYSDKEREDRIRNKIDPVMLTIKWESSLPFDSVGALTRKNKGLWTEDEKKYIGKQIIKDIGMVKLNSNK